MSSYLENYWLPMLGPSATWALRRIAAWLATAPPSGLWLPVEPLARSLGLGSAAGRNCPMRRTLARLVDFRMAELDKDRDVLAVLVMARKYVHCLRWRVAACLFGMGSGGVQHECVL